MTSNKTSLFCVWFNYYMFLKYATSGELVLNLPLDKHNMMFDKFDEET